MRAIFTMGVPAAGKSTYVAEHLADEFRVIDPDAIKEAHPEYDPKNPAALHAYSKAVANAEFAEAIANGEDFVLDGTGTNHAALIKRIREAELAGYRTKVVFVSVPLKVSLERNAARERVVPEDIVRDKFEAIEVAFELVAREVHDVEVVDNS